MRAGWTQVVPAEGAPAAVQPAAEEEGAGTVPYRTTLAPSGERDLDSALSAASQLLALQEQAPTTATGIIARASADQESLARVLHAQGYWGGAVRVEIAGQPLGGADLIERLAAAQPPVPVTIRVEPRARYQVARVVVRAEGGAAAEAAVQEATRLPFGLAPGDPAVAAAVLAAERTLLDRLLAAGHPLAGVAGRETVVDYDRRTMEVAWTLAPGPPARFAPPAVQGAVRVDPAFLSRYAAERLAGEPYSPRRLERARRDLLALGPFGSVRVETGEVLDPSGRLPVTFVVSERPRRAIGGTVAYETNYGPAVRLYWEHRNLFGGAERLRLEGEVARIGTGGRGGLDQMTYRAFATLRDPGLTLFGVRDLTLVGSLGALRERLEAYDRDAVLASALLERRVSEQLTAFAGPTLDIGQAGPPGGPLRAYQIAGITTGARFDGTDSLLDPARGWRLTGTLTPSYAIREQQPFAPLRVTASTYRDLLGEGRGILALRGTVGSMLGANRLEIPQHLRFFAGGGGSVRGYDYQSIGPRDPVRNRPLGGGSLLELSAEWRQRILGDWGAVAFVDAGTLGSGSAPDLSNLRVGVGAGVRYYTPIGPIRADAALPLVRQQGSSGYGIYVGIGQAF
jgi:translocation and assembly module TamA